MVEPSILKLIKSRIATLQKFSALGPEQERKAITQIFSLQNSAKAYEGRLKGLKDPAVMATKQKSEDDFRRR